MGVLVRRNDRNEAGRGGPSQTHSPKSSLRSMWIYYIMSIKCHIIGSYALLISPDDDLDELKA